MVAGHLETFAYIHQMSWSEDYQESKSIMEEKWGGEKFPDVVTLDGRVDERTQL